MSSADPCGAALSLRCATRFRVTPENARWDQPLGARCNFADGQSAHRHILLHGEIHAAMGSSHELICVTQLIHDGCKTLQMDVSKAHAAHVFMQPRDDQRVVTKVLQGA